LGLHAAILLAWVVLIPNRAAETRFQSPLVVELESEVKAPRKPEEKLRQIVRTREVQDSRPPNERAFLGERNQTVDRQTISALGGERSTRAPQQKAMQARSAKPDLSRFGLPLIPAETSSRVEAGSDPRVKEYVQGVRDGQETALSTREFVFYGYFERIRQRLDRAWEPILRDHLVRHYRQGRRLASEMDHRTQVLVVLDTQGKIVRVEVLGESGTEILDSAAVQAFNRAGPFPNPPRGLIERDGSVQIRWEFILKT
jgi:TonB family protein